MVRLNIQGIQRGGVAAIKSEMEDKRKINRVAKDIRMIGWSFLKRSIKK